MDIAVLSDIHGNHVALEACIKYALEQNINTFVFLGDYVGELSYPQKTMSLIYELMEQYTCYFVKGNKEDYWINYERDGEHGWKENDSTTGSLLYTYRNLTEKDMDFFKGLKFSEELHFESVSSIVVCHGSPNKVNEKLLPDNEKTFEIMDRSEFKYILCGHTHVQGKILHNGKKVLNPGAVGVSLHSGGKAQFMIMHSHDNEWEEEFISLDYDVEKVIFELKESGLSEFAPCWSKITEHLLRTGEVSHGSVLQLAMQYCSEELGDCNWPDIPEKYWEKAVKEILS